MLKLILIILLSFIFTLRVYSQNDSLKSKRLIWGISVSPDICKRITTSAYSTNWLNSSYDKIDKLKISYSASFVISYLLNKYLTLNSGLTYSNKGFKTKIDGSSLSYSEMIDNRNGFVYPTQDFLPVKYFKSIFSFHYISVPLKLNCYLSKGKTKFYISSGIALDYLLTSKLISVVNYENSPTKRSTSDYSYGFTKYNISPLLGFGLERKLSKKLILQITPEFRFGIITIKKAPISTYLWSCGLNTTILF